MSTPAVSNVSTSPVWEKLGLPEASLAPVRTSSSAVAAASVIARELFIRDIQKMTAEVFGGAAPMAADGDAKAAAPKIPMGSSDPRVRSLAEEMVRAHGPTWLMNHCKAHFQTTDKVLAACGGSRADLPPEGQVTSRVTNAGRDRRAS